MSEQASALNHVILEMDFEKASKRLEGVVKRTPLILNRNLSRRFSCRVFLKREDLQVVRSYKIRGAYNLLSVLPKESLKPGVVCASAGNHAQGFAYSCARLGLKGTVFMPVPTPKQKVRQVAMFGEHFVEVVLTGDTFDDCHEVAQEYCQEHGMTFIPPFEHPRIIEGQGTVGLEILQDLSVIDYLFLPVGGGGLASGVGSYFRMKSPNTKIIGLEPEGAPSMLEAFRNNGPVTLREIDKFVDGASVKRVGQLTYNICSRVLDKVSLVPEGRVCSTILSLYNEDAIVVEPAGALSIAGLEDYADQIRGRTVVCIVSGSNNDIDRMQEIKERSLLYEGLKHYFIIRFVQRPGSLKEFVNDVLGPNDDIVRFEFIQKHNKESGPALVGVELKNREDYQLLIQRMDQRNISYTLLNPDDNLFGYLV